MRSLQIANIISSALERARYTDLQVLKSAAGWYIGTLHNAIEGWQEPGSRDSCYFASKEIAEKCLAKLEEIIDRGAKTYCEAEEMIPYWENWIHANGYDPQQVGYRFTP